MKASGLLKIIVSLTVVLLMAGCVSMVPLQRSQIDSFRTGDSATELQGKIGKSTPTLEHAFAHAGVSYTARHFNLQTGTQQSGTVICTPVCMYIPIIVPIYTSFVIVYGKGGHGDSGGSVVRAYGTLEELSKSHDETVSAFMPALKAGMEKARTEKKKG